MGPPRLKLSFPISPYQPVLKETLMPKYLIEFTLSGAGELGDDELKETVQKSFAGSAAVDCQVEWLESYVDGDKLYCIYHAADESAINQLAAQENFSVNSIARIAASLEKGAATTILDATAEETESVPGDAGLSVATNPEFSQASDSTVENSTNPSTFPAEGTGDVSSQVGAATTGIQKKDKPRKRLGPLANLVGMVVFGIVGLVLGFGVLMLIPDEHYPKYGKAGKIIKMFPAVVQDWFDRSKTSPHGLEHSGGWKIGGRLQDHEAEVENKPANSAGVSGSETKNGSSQKTKANSERAKTYRTFTDSTGKHQTEAYLKDFSDGNAYLEKRNGEIKEVPLNKLSAEDQQWLRSELERRKNLEK